jgi:hypothetical protein
LAKQLEIKDAPGGCSPAKTLEHFNSQRLLKFKVDQAVALLRVAKKQAKSDGYPQEAADLVDKLRRKPVEEASLFLKQLGIVAKVTDQPWADLPLFAPSNDMAPSAKLAVAQALEDAEHEGRLKGAAGGNKNDNPHRVGTELFVRWADGFNNGWEFFEQRAVVEKKVKTAGTGKKGRPPGKNNPPAKSATAAGPSAVQ